MFDRLDYVANFNNELVYCQAVEKLMGLEVPERAEYVRVILCELNRIASHLVVRGDNWAGRRRDDSLPCSPSGAGSGSSRCLKPFPARA